MNIQQLSIKNFKYFLRKNKLDHLLLSTAGLKTEYIAFQCRL